MFTMKVHPSSKKRTNNHHQRSQNAVVSPNPASNLNNKKLWKLPHVFASVLELPFRSDDDVSIDETTQFLRFVASCKCNKINAKGSCGVRAHAIQILPGITKIVIKGMDGGDRFTEQYGYGGTVDVWRYRLPPWTLAEMATAVCSRGKLVVTVPKSRGN